MRVAVPMWLLLAACAGGHADHHGDHGNGDTTDGTIPAGEDCGTLDSGTWEATGTCLGHTMSGTLTFSADTCSFTLGEWSMEHDAPPSGGSLVGNTVTLHGGAVDGCTGTQQAQVLAGACPDECVWQLARTGD